MDAALLSAADAELATLLRLETRSQNLRRAALESELAEAYNLRPLSAGLIRAVRAEMGRCDRALMELCAGRLPAVVR